MADLAIVVVSTNEAHWLRPCLSTVFSHANDVDLDVVVADNSSTDGTRELVETEFPSARVVTCANHGFGHANNRGYETTDAPYVLFLNPDTETIDGSYGDLVAWMDASRDVGVAGVRQVMPDGTTFPTIRRFPTVSRSLFEALAAERVPVNVSWLGERELDMRRYDTFTDCDWVSGSFMLVRRAALEAAGVFDERFFLFSEEVDLCYRIKQAGWRVVHSPTMTIVHHADKAGFSERMAAQDAFARRLFVEKHSSVVKQIGTVTALALRYGVRVLAPASDERARARKAASRTALLTLLGRREPPFGRPPAQALWPEATTTVEETVERRTL